MYFHSKGSYNPSQTVIGSPTNDKRAANIIPFKNGVTLGLICKKNITVTGNTEKFHTTNPGVVNIISTRYPKSVGNSKKV